jgi:hypothetical protein
MRGGKEEQLHPIPTSAVDGWEWLASSPGCFTSENKDKVTEGIEKLVGSKCRSRRFLEKRNSLFLAVFES